MGGGPLAACFVMCFLFFFLLLLLLLFERIVLFDALKYFEWHSAIAALSRIDIQLWETITGELVMPKYVPCAFCF